MTQNFVSCDWQGAMSFMAHLGEHSFLMDAPPASGGKDEGPQPKPVLLAALAGCTAMDVAYVMNKKKLPLKAFSVKVTGTLTEKLPHYYDRIHLVYSFEGDQLPLDELEKAVNDSQEKYCGVSALLRFGAEITYELELKGLSGAGFEPSQNV